MGSWNVTCGITQLPIAGNQRVAVIPLVVKQHDFLARDMLAGSGSVANDLIAQPFALPLFGNYDNQGSVQLDSKLPGAAYLSQTFENLVKSGRLFTHPEGKPVPVKKASAKFFEKMMHRELLVTVPNQRKLWLKQMHEVYAGLPAEKKKGMSHYKAQMEVDPATLPDDILLGLGAMLVPEALYQSLADTVAVEKAYGYYDRQKEKSVDFDGNRRGELINATTLDAEAEKKLANMRQMIELQGDAFSEEERGYLLDTLPGMLLRYAYDLSARSFYFETGAAAALKDMIFKGDAAARSLWVDFMLFNSAMTAMRKQWTPQTGAGNSCALYETHQLYQVVNDFVGKTLLDYKARRG